LISPIRSRLIEQSTYITSPHALPPLLLSLALLSFLGSEIFRHLAERTKQDPLVVRVIGTVDQALFTTADLDGIGQIWRM
jgi:hypothetical protein